jgi:tripartite ATP-independent transporter DctM subunit
MNFSIGTAVLILLMILSVPIGFALGLAGVASLAMIVPTGSIAALMTRVVHSTVSNSAFLTVPMFILMAEFLSCGGVAEDLLLACNRMLRRVRGGLAMACILAGAVHAAATGSSAASAASLARASFPAMMKAGYAPSFAAGTIAIAGTLAIMIPPSVAFVLYGLMTETSIGKLFLAGIIPGLLTAFGYILTISVVLWWRPQLGPDPRKEAEVAASTKASSDRGRTWPMVLLIAVILVGLYGGVATPTEISAIGALGALLISLSSGRMTRSNFAEAVGATLRITTMIIAIVYGAHLFGYFISFSKITDTMLTWIAASGMAPILVVIVITVVYLLLGTFMDQAAIIILTAPITTPLVVGLGYDPVWWGVLMIKTAEDGLVSPPLGLVTFVVASSTKTDVRSSFMGVLSYITAELLLLAILVAFPEITLWLTR